MMNLPYLDMLDQLLASGVAGLSDQFVQAQVGFVLRHQHSDGGFTGRQGPSDLYYTDFALRTLCLLSPAHPALNSAADYLEDPCHAPRNLVPCFNLLNAGRLLQQHNLTLSLDHPELAALVLRHLLPGGGFTRTPDQPLLSAYQTFLAALSFQLMELDVPLAGSAVQAVASLRCADGGYAESPGQSTAQTNATAAAVAFLLMQEALGEDDVSALVNFLVGMQASDGGLKAHAATAHGDLLSTFTGLLTLWSLQSLDRLDLSLLARFLRGLAIPTGGFRATVDDTDPDVEYTYYGIATMALLRLRAQSSR